MTIDICYSQMRLILSLKRWIQSQTILPFTSQHNAQYHMVAGSNICEKVSISYLEHKTNDFLLGPQEPLLATMKRRELACSLNSPSGHLGGWVTPWSAEEMLDGQHQRVDIPAHARTACNCVPQKRLEEDLY